MRKVILTAIVVCVILLSSSIAIGSEGKKWTDHAFPWDFSLDPVIDMVHEYKATGPLNDAGYTDKIKGFMYIRFVDDVNATGGNETVGWEVHGRFAMAKFNGVGSAPPWTVHADDVPKPQGFVHWHPLGGHAGKVAGTWYPGYFLKHTGVESFYFMPQGRMVSPGIDFNFPNNYNTIP